MLTLTRHGPVPPWYGLASVLSGSLAILSPYVLAPLCRFGVPGEHAALCTMICGFAVGLNCGIQAVLDPKQRKGGALGLLLALALLSGFFAPAL